MILDLKTQELAHGLVTVLIHLMPVFGGGRLWRLGAGRRKEKGDYEEGLLSAWSVS